MDKFLNNSKAFENMLGYSNSHYFYSALIKLPENRLTSEQITRILVLFNKHFPSFRITSGLTDIKNNSKCWEDIVLNDLLPFGVESLSLNLKVPVYIQRGDEIEILFSDNEGIHLYHEYVPNEPGSLIVTTYVNAYTNVNYVFIGNKGEPIDQSIAAKKNREILSSLLKGLELLLGSEINSVESEMLDNKYVYKYGISEDAVLSI